MPEEFHLEDLGTGGPSAPTPAPSKDFLSSLIEFVNRAITLASELNKLITTAKTDLVPLIAAKVQREVSPGQPQTPAIPTDAESIYNQTLKGLEDLIKLLGDLPLSEVIAKMKKNKEVVIAAIKVKLQTGAKVESNK